jgi:hypothetical protein
MDNLFNITTALLVPMLTGIGQALKTAGVTATYVPFINMALGAVISLLLMTDVMYLPMRVVIGLVAGLASCGLFDITKVVFKK